MVIFTPKIRSSVGNYSPWSWLFTAQEAVTPGLALCLYMSLPTSRPGPPTAGTTDTLQDCVQGPHLTLHTRHRFWILYWAQGWRDKDGQPHTDGTQRFPEKDRECSKDGLGFGKG